MVNTRSGRSSSPDRETGAPASAVKKAYLVLFNLGSATGWAYVFYLAITHFVRGGQAHNLWPAIGHTLCLVQSMAVLELVHAFTGLVRSSVATTALQLISRLALAWGVCWLFPEARNHKGFALMALSWCLVEVPRYLFYMAGQLGSVPYPLLWIRYSLFMVLYPTGISGELLCIWNALPATAKTDFMRIAMPNAFNFSFHYHTFLLISTLLYVPGSPFLYSHMTKQRAKVLAKAKAKME